jgi:hypothetical protein
VAVAAVTLTVLVEEPEVSFILIPSPRRELQ